MISLRKLVRDESGAAAIDWISLVSAVLLLGLVVVYSVYNVGVASVAWKVESALDDVQFGADPDALPDLANRSVVTVGRQPVLTTDSLAARPAVGTISVAPAGRIARPAPAE